MAYSDRARQRPPLPAGLPSIIDLRRLRLPPDGARGGPVVVAWRHGVIRLVSGAGQIRAARERGQWSVDCLIRVRDGSVYASAALV